MTSVNEVPRYKVRILKNFILRHFLFRFSYLNNKQKFFLMKCIISITIYTIIHDTYLIKLYLTISKTSFLNFQLDNKLIE